ncbi:hypothetical protein TNCV_798881 [Trichonephila clavipes]|nr:hypothetical protein TNCV_798881 [Trichonephila clavipes]
MNCQTKLGINHWAAVKSVAILENAQDINAGADAANQCQEILCKAPCRIITNPGNCPVCQCNEERSGRKGTRAASSLPDGRFFLADVRGKKPREMACVRFKADRTTSKRIRYGFITVKSTTLIGLNNPRKNTTLPTIRFVEPRRTHIPV